MHDRCMGRKEERPSQPGPPAKQPPVKAFPALKGVQPFAAMLELSNFEGACGKSASEAAGSKGTAAFPRGRTPA